MAISDAEQELYDNLANEIAREMDDSILSTILTQTGWTPVEFHFKDNFQAVNVNDWLNEHCPNNWARLGSDYLFKDKQDAEWFILRWL